MQGNSLITEQTLISETLQRLNQAGHLDVAEISDLLGVHTTTAWRYVSGEIDFRFSQYRTLVRQCRSDVARLELISVIVAGVGYLTLVDHQLDLDSDADISTDDIMTDAVEVVQGGAKLIKETHKALGDKRITGVEGDRLRHYCDAVIQRLVAVQKIVNDETARQARRRRCKPLSTGG